jgi:hypothetical protein
VVHVVQHVHDVTERGVLQQAFDFCSKKFLFYQILVLPSSCSNKFWF